MFSLLNKSISRYLEKAYDKEEDQLKRKIEAVRESGTFNAYDYGQDPNFTSCPLIRSAETLQELNKTITPFDIITVLNNTHKQILSEIEEYSISANKTILINKNITMASLMTAFLNARILQVMKNTMYLEYFSYASSDVGEVSIFVKKSRRVK